MNTMARMAVYRDYDQAALDAQYNNRALVPDFQDYLDRWNAKSAAVRRTLPCHLDLAYGPGERQCLDIFPTADQPAPALVFIHGGYWQALDKAAFSYPAPAVVGSDVAYVALSYPLTPAAGMDEIVASIREALAWLWRHGADYGIDPGDIHVAGHSAGGHLAAMAMQTDWPAFAADLPAELVQSGMPISGLYDLDPIRRAYLNEVLGLDAESARRNSPIHDPAPAQGAMFLAVGEDESDEFRRQQAVYFDAWSGRGGDGVAVELPDRNHFSMVDGLDDPDDTLFRAILAMIFPDAPSDAGGSDETT